MDRWKVIFWVDDIFQNGFWMFLDKKKGSDLGIVACWQSGQSRKSSRTLLPSYRTQGSSVDIANKKSWEPKKLAGISNVFQINHCFRISRTFIAVWSSSKKTFHFAPPKEQNPTCDVSSAALFAMAKRSLVSDSDRNSSINEERWHQWNSGLIFQLHVCWWLIWLCNMFQTCQINRLGWQVS